MKATDSISLEYLPEITLNFRLPIGYPNKSPPDFYLTCVWLDENQSSAVERDLLEIWSRNRKEVLFDWNTFLKEELLQHLGIKHCYPLDVNGSHKSIVDAIILNDAKRKNERFMGCMFTCAICFDEYRGNECKQLEQCKHTFCRGCLKEHFETQVKSTMNFMLACPEHGCDVRQFASDIPDILDRDSLEICERRSLNLGLLQLTDLVWCPRIECQYPAVRDDKIFLGQCPSCSYAFCLTCFKSYHGVMQPCNGVNNEVYNKQKQLYHIFMRLSDGNMKSFKEEIETHSNSNSFYLEIESLHENQKIDILIYYFNLEKGEVSRKSIEEKFGRYNLEKCLYNMFALTASLSRARKIALVKEYIFSEKTEQENLKKKYGTHQLLFLISEEGKAANDSFNAISKKFIETSYKVCPTCKVRIDKNGGCSSMLCTNCGNNFWWEAAKI